MADDLISAMITAVVGDNSRNTVEAEKRTVIMAVPEDPPQVTTKATFTHLVSTINSSSEIIANRMTLTCNMSHSPLLKFREKVVS